MIMIIFLKYLLKNLKAIKQQTLARLVCFPYLGMDRFREYRTCNCTPAGLQLEYFSLVTPGTRHRAVV
jgi:hypothetical protein